MVAPFTAGDEHVGIALTGHPFLRDGDKIQSLGNPATAVLSAYIERGSRCLETLDGSFALAIRDKRQSSWLFAVDRMGIERLCFGSKDGRTVFASSALDVAKSLTHSPRLSRQALYDYLLSHMVPAPGTAFEGVSKLQAATFALLDARGIRTQRYWTPAFETARSADVDLLAGELRVALNDAVMRCAPGEDTGAFLSGGLDSSTVAGILAGIEGKAVKTFSIGFGVASYNELEYVRIANRHFGCEGHELHVTAGDIVANFDHIAAAYDEPFGNSSALPTYMCASLAASQGVTHLLAGDGGDELFGGNERYARQRVFELYAAIPALIRRGILDPLAAATDPSSPITPLRKLRSYVDQARVPLPERLETYNFAYREGAERLLHPDVLGSVDRRAPMRDRQAVYQTTRAAALVDRLLQYDWQYTLADNDLRKVGTMCELAGVRVSYPMLDPAVIDLSLRVPARFKVKGSNLRWFYKRAMGGFLPEEILRKSKHGFGLPFGVWLKTDEPLRALIDERLDSLRARDIVNADYLDDLRSNHQQGDPSFYGYPLWDLAMLEAWLRTHRISV